MTGTTPDATQRQNAAAEYLADAIAQVANAYGQLAIAGMDDHDYPLRDIISDLRRLLGELAPAPAPELADAP